MTLAEGGTVRYANQRLTGLLRRERSSLLGRDLADHDAMDNLLAAAPDTTAHEELTLVHPGYWPTGGPVVLAMMLALWSSSCPPGACLLVRVPRHL